MNKVFPTTSGAFRAAVEEAQGNLTRAARLLGISKVHAMRLAQKFVMRELARELRGFSTGRPRKSSETPLRS